jgi:hypothetical protein
MVPFRPLGERRQHQEHRMTRRPSISRFPIWSWLLGLDILFVAAVGVVLFVGYKALT